MSAWKNIIIKMGSWGYVMRKNRGGLCPVALILVVLSNSTSASVTQLVILPLSNAVKTDRSEYISSVVLCNVLL
jgi:hypothetical protein